MEVGGGSGDCPLIKAFLLNTINYYCTPLLAAGVVYYDLC